MGPVNGRPRPFLGGWEEVGADAEGEAGVGVAEVVGDGPDALSGVVEHRGVEVAEGVHAIVLPRREDQIVT